MGLRTQNPPVNSGEGSVHRKETGIFTHEGLHLEFTGGFKSLCHKFSKGLWLFIRHLVCHGVRLTRQLLMLEFVGYDLIN